MRKFRDEQKGLVFILLIVLIMASAVAIFSVSLHTDVVQDTLDKDKKIQMLIGVEDTDHTLLFASVIIYYPSSQKAALINIPGYTGSIYASLNRTDQIKKVYEERGIESYREEVRKLIGIQIPFYTIISMENFARLTDYFGGLRVFISEPIDYMTEEGVMYLLPSGAVNLDGDKILTYLHYKLADEDETDLQERYQNAMTAFITALSDKKFLLFDGDNFKNYANCFTTNLKTPEEEKLFKLISDVDSESIIRQTITGSFRNVDGQSLLFPLNNGENVRNNVRQVSNMLVSSEGTYNSRVYVLEIQNGTTTQGLARNTSILFQNASYDVLSAVNADRNDYEETVIIDRLGNAEAAKAIGDFIHCDNIIKADSENAETTARSSDVDFTIILGRDFNGQYVIKRRK